MSRASQPTIPFVLPLYEQMDAALLTTSNDSSLPFNLQCAASVGREKLLKYKVLAERNQYYIIGTSKEKGLSILFSIHTQSSVLHPFLRAAWFKTTVTTKGHKEDISRAQQNAIERVETLFTHVAQTYYDNPLPSDAAPEMAASSSASGPSISKGDAWLAQICDFELDIATPELQSKDQLKEEIQRYFKFEGGRGELQNPLAWWKVSPKLQN